MHHKDIERERDGGESMGSWARLWIWPKRARCGSCPDSWEHPSLPLFNEKELCDCLQGVLNGCQPRRGDRRAGVSPLIESRPSGEEHNSPKSRTSASQLPTTSQTQGKGPICDKTLAAQQVITRARGPPPQPWAPSREPVVVGHTSQQLNFDKPS